MRCLDDDWPDQMFRVINIGEFWSDPRRAVKALQSFKYVWPQIVDYFPVDYLDRSIVARFVAVVSDVVPERDNPIWLPMLERSSGRFRRERLRAA